MTTSTLQVPRRGTAGLRRPQEARRGLRAGSLGGRGAFPETRRPAVAYAGFCVHALGAEGHLRSRTPGPPGLAEPRGRYVQVAAPRPPWGSASPGPHRRRLGTLGLVVHCSLSPLLLPPFRQAPASSMLSDSLFSANDPSFIA